MLGKFICRTAVLLNLALLATLLFATGLTHFIDKCLFLDLETRRMIFIGICLSGLFLSLILVPLWVYHITVLAQPQQEPPATDLKATRDIQELRRLYKP